MPQAHRSSKGNLMCMSLRLKFIIAPAGRTCGSPSELSETSDGEAGERVRGEEEHEDEQLAIGEERVKTAGAAWLIRVATNATEADEVEVALDGTGNGTAAPANPGGELPAWPPLHGPTICLPSI